MIKIQRALISVSDKKGLLPLAKGLAALGVEILSTGGTARALREAGLKVKDVSEHTGFPEMLDGRVKTLHPKIHGGLLSLRDNPEHMAQIKKHKIELIDMVVVNLYPFEKVTQKKNVSLEEAIENIDIGGPSMLRSGAKNYKSVAVLCNPGRYQDVLEELNQNSGILSDRTLMKLATEAFEHTARYDRLIYTYLNRRQEAEDMGVLPQRMDLKIEKHQDLRYGENPHQNAALYKWEGDPYGLVHAKQLHGKELSFNNFLDLNAAVAFIKDFKNPAAVIIKHNNPTGVAENKNLEQAYKNAHACDPLSAFGGIIGLNRDVDAKTARAIENSGFMECILAPGFKAEARKILTKKKNVRLLEFSFKDLKKAPYDFKPVTGGVLVQQTDERILSGSDVTVVTKKKPTQAQLAAMLFGWGLIKNVKSNAIVLVKAQQTVGIGCGQTSRVDSVRIAIEKAAARAKGSVLISDAFFPKTDNITYAAEAGIKAIIQPGGSIADKDVIQMCDKHGIAMVFTGVRHFKH